MKIALTRAQAIVVGVILLAVLGGTFVAGMEFQSYRIAKAITDSFADFGEEFEEGFEEGFEESDDEPEDTLTASFGEAVTYRNSLTVTVGAPEAFRRSEWASGGEGSAALIKFKVTITNDGDEPYDASMLMLSVQSGTGEGDEVYDTDGGLDGGLMTSVLPGRTVEFWSGWGVDDADDLVVQLTPGFDYRTLYVTSGG